MDRTDIENVIANSVEYVKKPIVGILEQRDTNKVQFFESLFDCDYDIKDRMKLFESLNPEDQIEFTKRLINTFVNTQIFYISEYLWNIAQSLYVNIYARLEALGTLINYDVDNETYHTLLYNILCLKTFKELNISYRIKYILINMNSPYLEDKLTDYFIQNVLQTNISDLFKYKTILLLETKIKYLTEFLNYFVKDTKNSTELRILSAQYLFKLGDTYYAEPYLIEVGENESLNVNVRMDAIDVLLNNKVERARFLLNSIGTQKGKSRTVYENTQNVHNKAIEESAISIILHLKDIQSVPEDYDTVYKNILDGSESLTVEDREKIKNSLNRITLDRSLYSHLNFSLRTILVKVYKYIQSSDATDELNKRLLEELIDSSGLCASGFAFRIVNTLSEYTDLSIKISFEDQIEANLLGRLNARIRILTQDKQDKIIIQMMESKNENKPDYLEFLKVNIPALYKELLSEYNDLLNKDEFDLYFRNAMMKYEK